MILYSEFKDQHIDLKEYDVLLLDTIGLLTKVYSEATIAYVGGAIGTTGLHNILEPAVFGAPLIIGNHFEKFPEAKILQKLEGLTAISNYREFKNELNTLVQNESFRTKKGQICKDFILSNTGATNKVMSYISREKLL